MIATQIDVTDSICSLRLTLESAARVLEGMAVICMDEDADSRAIILAMARLSENSATYGLRRLDEITEWCRMMDMQRIEREVALAAYEEADESKAIRELSRKIAREIEAICKPAMRTITEMQNKAGDIDAMVQRARDMGGCLKVIHRADRDPNKPEVGSIREAVEEARDSQPLRTAMQAEGQADVR